MQPAQDQSKAERQYSKQRCRTAALAQETAAHESGTKVGAMQLEYNASSKYDDCNRDLSRRYLDQYTAPAQEEFCIQLIPTPVDETNKKDFTAAWCLTVTALGDWQSKRGNTTPEDAVPQKNFLLTFKMGHI